MRRENNGVGFTAVEEDGVITIKYDADGIEMARKDEIYTFASSVDMLDCYIIGEQYCLGNFDMAFDIYNNYTDLIYCVPYSELNKLKNGEEIKLYGHTPDDDERETIEKEWED